MARQPRRGCHDGAQAGDKVPSQGVRWLVGASCQRSVLAGWMDCVGAREMASMDGEQDGSCGSAGISACAGRRAVFPLPPIASLEAVAAQSIVDIQQTEGRGMRVRVDTWRECSLGLRLMCKRIMAVDESQALWALPSPSRSTLLSPLRASSIKWIQPFLQPRVDLLLATASLISHGCLNTQVVSARPLRWHTSRLSAPPRRDASVVPNLS